MIPLPGDHVATRLAIPWTLWHDGPSRLDILPALLAQLAEQLTLNQRVVGSSPTGGTAFLTPENRPKSAGNKGIASSAPLPHPALSIGTDRHRPAPAGASTTPQNTPRSIPQNDPRLEAVIDAWDGLPE